MALTKWGRRDKARPTIARCSEESFVSDAIHDHARKVLQLNVIVVDELCVGNDFLDLCRSHPLTHVHHRVLELLHRDLAILICIEHL